MKAKNNSKIMRLTMVHGHAMDLSFSMVAAKVDRKTFLLTGKHVAGDPK
jgi:hypothetical protein